MQIAMAGLGRMGMNMARRLLKGGHEVIAFNRSEDKVREAVKAGAKGAYDLEELVKALTPPRHIWLMLPAGGPTEEAISSLKGLLKKNDTIIDGGNTYYKDDIARAEALAPLGINYMDAGTSGGIWGLKLGYCLMVGGDPRVYRRLLPALKTLAPKDGVLHCGPVGSGHFVKMVHNGIEYGMMSAYAEGFEIMKQSRYGGELDLEKVAHLWNQGSVIRSWLLELAASALRKDPGLDSLAPYVEDSGEGRWTIHEAVETGVPAPVITASVYQRFSSRQGNSFSHRVLAALRNEFGGHAVKKKGQ